MPVIPDALTRCLAFDTATDTLHLGLLEGARLHVRQAAGGAQGSATLLPLLRDLLSQAGVGWADLQAVAYGRGPGGFTGLRTACSVAQGLALGAGLPVLTLDTLAAVAECGRRQGAGERVWAMQDARMGEVYAGLYVWQAGRWECLQAAALYEPAALAVLAQQAEATWAGNALKAYAVLQDAGVPSWPEAVPDGAALLALAQAQWLVGPHLDAAQALPLYVRDKVAQTTAERAAQRIASS
jgi:tRNA threonylcarbamoyladenosine biosynthesis protein TsaB